MTTTALLTEKDIEKCLEIYNYYIKSTSFSLEEEELSPEAYRARVAGITKKYPFIVAHDESGEAVGFAYLNVFNERSAYRHTADLSIYVDSSHTHEHIGEILLAALEKLAADHGITNIISIITDINTASVKFHEKHGFVREGRIADIAIKFGKSCGIYYYRKKLI